jgi:hypothetical protein
MLFFLSGYSGHSICYVLFRHEDAVLICDRKRRNNEIHNDNVTSASESNSLLYVGRKTSEIPNSVTI